MSTAKRTKLTGIEKWGKFCLLGEATEYYGHPVYSNGEVVGFEVELILANMTRPVQEFLTGWYHFYEIEKISWYKMLTDREVFAAKLAGKI